MQKNNMKKRMLTVNTLFSGAGCQELGIRAADLGDVEVVATSEISIDAIIANAAINCGLTMEKVRSFEDYPDKDIMVRELEKKNIGYNPGTGKAYDWAGKKKTAKGILLIRKVWLAVQLTRNCGDISEIKKLPPALVWTVSFPCQDISIAGKQKGFKKGSHTKSSTLWEQIRLLERSVSDSEAPAVIMFENVKALGQKKFEKDFQLLLGELSRLGYNAYYKVLNAKDFGVPQNRERVFVYCIRKDVDLGTYTFPEPTGLMRTVDEILDPGQAFGTGARFEGIPRAGSAEGQRHGR